MKSKLLHLVRLWFYKQSLKDATIRQVENRIKCECIGYSNWLSARSQEIIPKKENGMWRDCWEVYDYYIMESGKRNTYFSHAEKFNNTK